MARLFLSLVLALSCKSEGGSSSRSAAACIRYAVPPGVVSAITSPAVIRRILEHLDLPTELPAFAPARGPPQDELCAFDGNSGSE